MDTRQILILLKIGEMDVSNKCVKSVSVDRNFSDVGDKFSIDIVDTPDTKVAYDLELYMAAGYRSITLKYGDISEGELVSYSGTIWDYTNTFVGNIKTLTITGIMSRFSNVQTGVGEYTYNIDWNSYFNKRENEKEMYGAMKALLKNKELLDKYMTYDYIPEGENKYVYDDKGELVSAPTESSFISSAILNPEYRAAINSNNGPDQRLKIKGPSGKIVELPIPDSFVAIPSSGIPGNKEEIVSWMAAASRNEEDPNYVQFYQVVKDPKKEFWGELHLEGATTDYLQTATKYYSFINPYLASAYFVRNFSKEQQNGEPAYDEASQQITHITKEILLDSHAIRFPKEMMTNTNNKYGFKLASQYFVQERWLVYLYLLDTNVGTGPGNYGAYPEFWGSRYQSDSRWNWYNGGNTTEYKKFYKKIQKWDWKQAILDDKNSTDYVCNDDGLVIAFKFHRSGVSDSDLQTYVAVSKKDYESIYRGSPMDNSIYGGYSFRANYGVIVNDYRCLWYDYAGTAGAKISSIEGTDNLYFYDEGGSLRGFFVQSSSGSTMYVQANPDAKKSVYGTAGIVNSGVGVDISNIVKKLCDLEGWDYDETTITQTELVQNSDSFIMQGQTAMDFIVNNLVPKAITPLGEYVVYEKYNAVEQQVSGETEGYRTKIIDKPMGGFYPFFDDNGKFHFQPLTKENIKYIDIPNLGYNLPNSPMVSFQINTKGTAFYVNRIVDYSPLSIVTGGTVEGIDIASDSLAESIAATRGHNDTFDSWLGLTYDDVEKAAGEKATASIKYQTALSLAQNALVTHPSTFIPGSAEPDPETVMSRIVQAEDKITKTVIKATLSMWGNTKVAPAKTIRVTNMLKGGSAYSDTPQEHPSSGEYLILSMQDKIDSGGYIQNLNLLRYSDKVKEGINSYKIDYSKGVRYAEYKVTPSEPEIIGNKGC